MDRIPEPELMTARDQAEAYAQADFEESHSGMLRRLVERIPVSDLRGWALDLGCGPGDIAYRLAGAAPDLTIHGVDASPAMLEAVVHVRPRFPGVAEGRVTLLPGLLPDCSLPRDRYDVVVSNSLLHHLPDPDILWRSVRRWCRSGGAVFVMDLRRPTSWAELDGLVRLHAEGEPDVLRRDFANSLAAAYRVGEIEAQLALADMSYLAVEAMGDRHVIVHGHLP